MKVNMIPNKFQIKLAKEQKWDRYYKLPDYVEKYIKMINLVFPNIDIRPWTINRCVSFFKNNKYTDSLTYDQIEEIMS